MANGETVMLVRAETSPEDIGGMHVSSGILTSRGGMTSHAAVVARGMGVCAITGCGSLSINYADGSAHTDDGVVLTVSAPRDRLATLRKNLEALTRGSGRLWINR